MPEECHKFMVQRCVNWQVLGNTRLPPLTRLPARHGMDYCGSICQGCFSLMNESWGIEDDQGIHMETSLSYVKMGLATRHVDVYLRWS